MTYLVPLLACSLVASGSVARLQHAASTTLDVAGTWELNEAMSEELPLLPGEAIAAARASGALGLPALPATSRGRDARHRAVMVRNALRDAFRAATELKIVRDGQQLALTDSAGRTLTVALNGREQRFERERLRLTVAARWEAPTLTIERQYEDGTIVRESFLTFTEPRQLVNTITISHPRVEDEEIVVRRVYDAREGR